MNASNSSRSLGLNRPVPAPIPPEADRLAALHRYRILDTPEEEAFDRLAMLARDLLGAPIALVSLLDETRQWFKARVGLSVQETPRGWAFCEHAIQGQPDEVFVVTDAAADPRFASNPLVTDGPRIRFYAGAPLRTQDGFALGTVCVISDQARPEGITEAERRWLMTVAGLAVDELELRLQGRRAREAAEAEARLRRAQEAAGVVAFEVSSESDPHDTVLGALRRLLGLDDAAPLELHGLAASAHPDERARLDAEASRLAAEGGQMIEEFRVTMRDGAIAWAQIRGEVQFGIGQRPAGWLILGILRDVTERRQADERQTLMTRELDHRAKNALAVVLAALRLTPADDPKAYVAAVEGRVAALARAHSLLTARRWAGADLGDLVRGELQPFLEPQETAARVRAHLVGVPIMLAAQAAQPLSMALHELATNAIRHGALSVPLGQITVTWALEDDGRTLRLGWAETGGVAISGPPPRRGFGSQVMRGTITHQLGGRLNWDWRASGLVCEMMLPAARVLANIGEPARPSRRRSRAASAVDGDSFRSGQQANQGAG